MGLDPTFEDRFEERFGRYESRSDKLLYPYLDARIFGPYDGDCHGYLSECKLGLRDAGFEDAKLCSDGVLDDGGCWTPTAEADADDEPPDGYDGSEETYWWEKSRAFLDGADVSVFVFLDSVLSRPELPDRAFEESGKDPSDADDRRPEMNSSVVVELVYWLRHHDREAGRTLVLFEESVHECLGSLVPGLVEMEDADRHVIPDGNVDAAVEVARATCQIWAMGECRRDLRERRALDTDAFSPDL